MKLRDIINGLQPSGALFEVTNLPDKKFLLLKNTLSRAIDTSDYIHLIIENNFREEYDLSTRRYVISYTVIWSNTVSDLKYYLLEKVAKFSGSKNPSSLSVVKYLKGLQINKISDDLADVMMELVRYIEENTPLSKTDEANVVAVIEAIRCQVK